MTLKLMITLIALLTTASAYTISSLSDRCTQKFGEMDNIYHNGKIITVDEKIPIARAVAVKNAQR